MSKYDDFKLFVNSRDSKEFAKQFIEYAFKAVTGDFESLTQLIQLIKDSPAFYKNAVFVEKMLMFLDGVCLNEEDYKDLAETIANGNQEENAQRILDCLDSLETESKVKYLINATRSNIKFHRGMDGLDRNEYFRMIHILKNILLEDIEFLKDKLKLGEVDVNESCLALNNLGLMHVSVIGNETKYAFTSLAYKFYDEVIVYDDETFPRIPQPDVLPREFQIENVVEF